MTRMLLGEATPGVRAGGALCFFLDMPRLSATEPRKDRMPSRPSPAVQLAPCSRPRPGDVLLGPISPVSLSTLPHGRLRTRLAADAHNRES